MCIGFPGKIIFIDKNNPTFAKIQISGIIRNISLALVDEKVYIGDYVICHIGYAIHKINKELAQQKLQLLEEIIKNEIY